MSLQHPKLQTLLNHTRTGTPIPHTHVDHCEPCNEELHFLAMASLVARADDPLHRNHAQYISEDQIIDWLLDTLPQEESKVITSLVESCEICAALAQGIQNDLGLLQEAEQLQSVQKLALPWILRIHQGDGIGRELSVSHSLLTIGSDPTCDVHLIGREVAPLHAIIHIEAEEKLRLTIPALAPVLLEGQPIEFGSLLRPRQEFCLGGYYLRLENGPPPLSELESKFAAQADRALSDTVMDRLQSTWRRHKKTEPKGIKKLLEVREMWGDLLLDVRHFDDKTRAVHIGENIQTNNRFYIPQERLEAPTFQLLTQTSDSWTLNFMSHFRGYVEREQRLYSLEELQKSGQAIAESSGRIFHIELQKNDRFVVAIGPDLLSGTFVSRQHKLARNFTLDRTFASFFTIALIMTTVTFAAIRSIPAPEPISFQAIPQRTVRLLQSGTKAKKAEIAQAPVERPKSKRTRRSEAQANTPLPAPVVQDKYSKEAVRDKVRKSGLLKVIASNGSHGMSDQVEDVLNVKSESIERLLEHSATDVDGNGLVLRGNANIDGSLPEPISGPDIGSKQLAVASRERTEPKSTVSSPEQLIGGLDAETINLTVRRYAATVNNCQTRALNKNPHISGRSVVQLTVAPSGKVMDVEIIDNTTGSPDIASCLKKRMNLWKFPAYEGEISQFDLRFVFTGSD